MSGTSNRREYVRERQSNKVRYSHVGSEDYYDARLLDRGQGGLCMVAAAPLKTGSMVYVQVLDFYPDQDGLNAHRSFQGRVRWNKDLGDRERTMYGIGIQYTRPVCS